MFEKISVFSPNTGNYGPENTPNSDTFYPYFCILLTQQQGIHHDILQFFNIFAY